MRGLFGKKSVVGLEFDDGLIKGAEIRGKSGSLIVSAYEKISLPEGAIVEGVLLNQAQVTTALNKLWSKGKFRSKDVVIGISNQGIVIRFAMFPKVPANRLDNLIRFQAQDHLPVPLETVVLDYDVVGMKSDGERELLEVLLVAGRKEMLTNFLQVLTGAGLHPLEIEVLPLTLLRLLKKQTDQQVVALVDIGNGLSNMLIADGRKPRLARMMPIGLQGAERLVAAAAENEEDIFSVSVAGNEQLANNIRSTIGFYQSHKDSRPVEKIFLSGTGSQVTGLISSLEEQLHLPVTLVKPLEYLDVKFNGRSENNLNNYGLAMGLACRGWE